MKTGWYNTTVQDSRTDTVEDIGVKYTYQCSSWGLLAYCKVRRKSTREERAEISSQ